MKEGVNKKVFVGVSGGVDSAVSAGLLKKQGYNVAGVFIRTWTPDFIECTWRDERRDAMRVCATLDIPFLECDAEEAYKKNVADYMIKEYKNGRTPNPDVMCNREVKFGVFWNFAKKHGADFIATGHYARVDSNSSREATGVGAPERARRAERDKELGEKLFEMKCGKDPAKDQSYFLWTLTQEDLSHTLFPVGHLEKSKVRKLAKKLHLPTAEKKDSQGICFLGPIDLKEFLSHYIKTKRGDVLDEKGEIIGYHDGAVFFTLGERHGFTITKKTSKDEPYYVVGKDVKKNTITVTASPKDLFFSKSTTSKDSSIASLKDSFSSGPKTAELESFFFERSGEPTRGPEKKKSFSVAVELTNWITEVPKKELTAQIRYHGKLLSCHVETTGENTAKVIFQENVLVASGQSIVVYDGDICLGGGVVR